MFITCGTFFATIWYPLLFIFSALEVVIIIPQIGYFVYLWRKYTKKFTKATTNGTNPTTKNKELIQNKQFGNMNAGDYEYN